MPVPDFNSSGVLPPHLGNPCNITELSPYPVTSLEVCQKLSFSPDRREILRGWIAVRRMLRTLGYNYGFQWINGSFLEDTEKHRNNTAPGDIDVVSFLPPLAPGFNSPFLAILSSRAQTKLVYKVDHIVVPLSSPGEALVEASRYWCGLFSHRRHDGMWKGMLKVDLITAANDDAAKTHLDSLGTP